MLRLVPVLLVSLAACGDQRPCSSCPDLSGAYLASWRQGIALMGCPAEGPRPVNLNVTQRGNQLSVLVGGQELRGTLYDTFDYSVSGGLSAASYTLRGRAVVGTTSAPADGGVAPAASVRLVGTLFSRTGAASAGCELAEDYTADRL